MKNNNGNGRMPFSGGFDRFIDIIADMIEKKQDEMHINGEIKPENTKITGKYGFNIKLGPDGMQGINHGAFDDAFAEKKADTPKTVEPATDLFEEEDKVTLIAQLPGVKAEDVELAVDGYTVTLTAPKKEFCYIKKVRLKFVPEKERIKEDFNNSIYSAEILR